MSISFTDQNLSDISLEYIQYPDLRANAVTTKATVEAAVADFLQLDDGNKQFTDFYRSLVAEYNAELASMGEDNYTLPPSEAVLDAGALNSDNFFPKTPPWTNLPPKLQPENNGNPTIPTSSPTTEDQLVADIITQIDYLKNGFVGSKNTTLFADFTIGDTLIEVDDVTIYSIGDKITVLNPSGEGFYAEIDVITEVAAPQGELELTFLVAPTGNVLTGEAVTDSFQGFTNTERTGGGSLNTFETNFLTYRQGILDSQVSTLETTVGSTLAAVQALSDLKNKTANEAYVSSITSFQSDIDTWQVAVQRFGDTALNPFETSLGNRNTDIGTRATTIQGFLGSVAQDAAGEITGSGVFFDFAQWQDKRINLASGSRSSYYGAQNGVTVADKNIQILDTNRAEQDVYFVIQALTFNGDGTNTIFVSDTTGISATDAIKIFAEGQPVLDAVVQSTTATSVTLDITVSTDYSVASIARILKQN